MMTGQVKFRHLWAKAGDAYENAPSGDWHPLMLHLVDVAAVADAIMAREPESGRLALADALGMDWERSRL
jgi:CRISPR-associated endonuclease/helicase Cas3